MLDDRILDLADPTPPGGPPGVCFSESLVGALLAEFSRPGDLVLDPFAGFGTTLVVAERLGRRAIGVELLADRVEAARVACPGAVAVHHHDARDLAALDLPPIDASVSSPPYMTRVDHPEDPLTGYVAHGGDYHRYLEELAAVYVVVAGLVSGDGPILVNVATMRVDGVVTPLADDLADAVAGALRLEEVIGVRQPDPPTWMVSDHVLVLRAR